MFIYSIPFVTTFRKYFLIFSVIFNISTLFLQNKLSSKTFHFLSLLLNFIRNYKTNFRTWQNGCLYHKHSIFLWIMWITLWITHFIRIFLPQKNVNNKLSTFSEPYYSLFILQHDDEKNRPFLWKLHNFCKVNTKKWNTQLSVHFKI